MICLYNKYLKELQYPYSIHTENGPKSLLVAFAVPKNGGSWRHGRSWGMVLGGVPPQLFGGVPGAPVQLWKGPPGASNKYEENVAFLRQKLLILKSKWLKSDEFFLLPLLGAHLTGSPTEIGGIYTIRMTRREITSTEPIWRRKPLTYVNGKPTWRTFNFYRLCARVSVLVFL